MSEKVDQRVILVDPTGHSLNTTGLHISPRPSDLRGKRLGLLDNTKANAEVILRKIAEILDAKYEFSGIYYTKKHSSNLPPKPEVLSDIHRYADIVIAGIGDWGACSSGSLHDGITLEQQGIPTVSIITDVFIPTAEAYTKVMGFTEFPYLSCQHPISNASSVELEERAHLLAPKVERLFLQGTLGWDSYGGVPKTKNRKPRFLKSGLFRA